MTGRLPTIPNAIKSAALAELHAKSPRVPARVLLARVNRELAR